MQFIVFLGRQPNIGLAELECVHGANNVAPFSHGSALVEADSFDVQHYGGVVKAGLVTETLSTTSWQTISKNIIKKYSSSWANLDRKQTLGISAYNVRCKQKDILTLGLQLKRALKTTTTSLRLIPNDDIALSSAVSHHNKLGLSDNKTELLIVSGVSTTIVAESIGAQNITALAKRDQGRPKRDAFVGMLPPKLALTMLNMSGAADDARILDPFCGTGVVLQESMLRGHDVYGTDLSEKMVDYSILNLEWLQDTFHTSTNYTIEHGDAMETLWQQPIGAVVAETYLGQPFSAPPSPDKLASVRRNCDYIISSFLKNIAPQLKSGTPLCLAVPAWRSKSGSFSHLYLPENVEALGFKNVELRHVRRENLLYFREEQVVARELLILTKV